MSSRTSEASVGIYLHYIVTRTAPQIPTRPSAVRDDNHGFFVAPGVVG